MASMKKKYQSLAELAPYERDLPALSEFTLLAAILGPVDHAEEAFRKAAKFAALAARFHAAYSASTPEERAHACGDSHTALHATLQRALAPHVTEVPRPSTDHSLTYEDFLRRVIRGKDEAESTGRLRRFYQRGCPEGNESLTYAAEQIQALKQNGFRGLEDWNQLGYDYLKWWKLQRSEQNTRNRQTKA